MFGVYIQQTAAYAPPKCGFIVSLLIIPTSEWINSHSWKKKVGLTEGMERS